MRGPMTFATFMELALYHPEFGYYARMDRRSGRAGDFFTSVDVGPAFGTLLARQFDEMWTIVGRPETFDLVEAGAGSGRLARDILDAAARHHPSFYRALRLHLVEASTAARAAQPSTLADHSQKLASAGTDLPSSIVGVVFANELLDALPCHAVIMTDEGLQEVFVDAQGNELVERAGPPSTTGLIDYLADAGVELAPGSHGEINLQAMAWTRRAAECLHRGFLLIVDYGHDALELYSATHAGGTRTSYGHHVARAADPGTERPPWLDDPGAMDLTAHVDLTTVTRAGVEAGLTVLGRLDQTYFLLGLGLAELIESTPDEGARAREKLKQRLALKTLMLPGGLGSTHKVLLFGKGVGAPQLRGCSYSTRLT